jgi:hypothetical protein
MARYDRGYDRGLRGAGGAGRGQGREWSGARAGAGGYDRGAGYGGWGMTRMYREAMRGGRGPYNPPLGGRTEYDRGGIGASRPGGYAGGRAGGRYDTGFGGGRQGYTSGVRSAGYRRDELHGVRLDQSGYDTGWR